MNDSSAQLKTLLGANEVLAHMFDTIRLVDAQEGMLLEHGKNGELTETGVCCTNVFRSTERCKNCTSMRAYYNDKSYVKLEYLDGAVLLIFSAPVMHEGRRIVVEMVKNITDSMTVELNDETRTHEVTHIIDSLNKMAVTDALTGLFNRRHLQENLPGLIESCKRLSQPLCGAMLDIDDFKKVNDVYGHLVGDQLLVQIAGTLGAYIRRSSDWVARYGGEEFFLCFAGVDATACFDILERIRMQIEGNVIQVGENIVHVTASVGFAQISEADDVSSFIARCDELMYQAKREGKNRIARAM